jgi:hypothetical protein
MVGLSADALRDVASVGQDVLYRYLIPVIALIGLFTVFWMSISEIARIFPDRCRSGKLTVLCKGKLYFVKSHHTHVTSQIFDAIKLLRYMDHTMWLTGDS